MAGLRWLQPGWPLSVPQGLPSFSGFARACPCGSWTGFQRREQQCFRSQGAGLRTSPASLPPPSSDQSQPQVQPRFKGQENLHLLMAGAVESHDKTGGFSRRGITIFIWWSSSDSGWVFHEDKKNHYRTRVSVWSFKMTGGTVKRRCHLGQVGTDFPGKCWKSIIQSLVFLFSGLKSPQAVPTYKSLHHCLYNLFFFGYVNSMNSQCSFLSHLLLA